MFLKFFYKLREAGIPLSPTAFLRLHRALHMGLISSLYDLYVAARAILIKNEKYFDLYDKVFAHCFEGVELKDMDEIEISEVAKNLLEEWLGSPDVVASILGISEQELEKIPRDELINRFMELLRKQDSPHHGGNRWIGTGGTSPFGHSGFHPGGMRIGGISRNRSAVLVALDRRYRDYSQQAPIEFWQVGEALKRLRHMVPEGIGSEVDIRKTVEKTVKNAGEIEIVFKKSLKDKLKVILAIDNGGYSMDPYVDIVQVIFNYARSQFKDLKILYFHNTIYDYLWEDPQRWKKSVSVDELVTSGRETRLIIVGDASMAPYELMSVDGAIYLGEKSSRKSVEILKMLSRAFPHSVWLNPVSPDNWRYIYTIGVISSIFKMFPLTLEGLQNAVSYLMKKN